MSKIGVLGLGTMGAGIVQIAAEAGYEVVMVDIDQAILDKAVKGIQKNWAKAVEKGKKTADEAAAYQKLLISGTDVNMFADCEIVIEAIIENMDIKKKVFKQLGEICAPDAILATNTSALSITEIALASGRPSKAIGVHFFNPVPAMKLVEIIPGSETTEETITAVMDLVKKIGKDPVRAAETPGFIVNRILLPYINEAAILFGEGAAPAEEIDKAMKLGANMPMGPLALADLIGLDVCLMICEYFAREFGDPKYRPALVMRNKVRAGHLGRKTGKGFYDYSAQ